jgi:adenosylcobinamide-phosphate synthase
MAVISAAVGVSFLLLSLSASVSQLAADLITVLLLYTTFAAGDLARHARRVQRALEAGDLGEARHRAGMMVGRETQSLDRRGVVRATVESVAESTVDGVTAPLLYACLFGPVGAIAYKAINTLDSTFGYRDQKYRLFGWASARIDDAANWLPARLTALLVPVAAAATGKRATASLRVLLRDGRKHSSPNSGLSEAAFAGALGVQLGGVSVYHGESIEKPTLGDPLDPLDHHHIPQVISVMWLTTLLSLVLFLALGYGFHWAIRAAALAVAW